MKQGLTFITTAILFFSCTPAQQPVTAKVPIEGTWELVSGVTITKDSSSFTDYTRGQKMIKIINGSHFAFLKHDLNKGKDSAHAIYESGGGRYTLDSNQYTEYLDYCNYREWEGHEFKFTVAIHNDTLVQTGLEKLENLGIDRVIIEKYLPVKR